jgi:membrane protein required for colicin V production
MQAYDLLMLIILGLAIVWGAWKGLVWQVASIASMGLSYLVALRFRQQLAQFIDASPPWNMFLSMLMLFLGTGFVVWVAFNLVHEFIERVRLKEFDRQLGAVFGAAKGVLLCALVTLFAVTLLGDTQRQAICNSKSGYYIAVLLDRADPIMPKELHDVLAPYLDRLDRTIPHPHTEGGATPLSSLFNNADIQNVERQVEQAIDRQRGQWQQQLQTEVQSAASRIIPAAPPGGQSFPTGNWLPQNAAPAGPPHTAGRIEAQPAPGAPGGSFPRW